DSSFREKCDRFCSTCLKFCLRLDHTVLHRARDSGGQLMSTRTRNETRWSVPFHHYASMDAFLAAPLQTGGNTFVHNGRDIDLLIENRGAATTLVVFNGAIPLNVQYLPYFTGRGIAEDLGLNLIAVSDPVLVH